jgi:hypothetical protein
MPPLPAGALNPGWGAPRPRYRRYSQPFVQKSSVRSELVVHFGTRVVHLTSHNLKIQFLKVSVGIEKHVPHGGVPIGHEGIVRWKNHGDVAKVIRSVFWIDFDFKVDNHRSIRGTDGSLPGYAIPNPSYECGKGLDDGADSAILGKALQLWRGWGTSIVAVKGTVVNSNPDRGLAGTLVRRLVGNLDVAFDHHAIAMAMGKVESKAREARVNFILIVGCLFLDFG